MTYVVGDIHGMLEPLLELFRKLPLGEGDEVIFLGDYIDRGPDSKGVVEFIMSLMKVYRVVLIRGNHEDMMMRCLEYGDCLTWEFNGAYATVRSFGSIEKISEYMEFFKETRVYHEKGRYVMVHGGIRPGVPLEKQDPFDMMWIRDEFIYSENPLPGRVVVFGHTPLREPLVLEDKIGVDTGCVYGGRLTAVRLEDLEIFQVRCSEW